MSRRIRTLACTLLVLGAQSSATAWEAPAATHAAWPPGLPGPPRSPRLPIPLAALVEEAKRSDPAILAAASAAEAAALAPPQASTLPDPRLTVQQLNVGSPLPFAGYATSEFAYFGLGVSQDLPYPGKRRLRGEVAGREAAAQKERADAALRDEIESLKTSYFRLSYLQQTLAILEREDALLRQVEKQAEARYAAGQGNQQDVLKAQLERTKILREIVMHHQLAGQAGAEVKRILGRPQDGPEIVTEPLSQTSPPAGATDVHALLARVREHDPSVRERAATVGRGETAVELARRDFRPDFGLSAMAQKTDPKFRDYYMLTFDVTLPRRKPRQAALAQAQVNLQRARQELDAELQKALAEVAKQHVIAATSEQQLVLYREGLIPQAQAGFRAALAAYAADRVDFETLLSSWRESLHLDLEAQQTLLDHEMAWAHLERLTGVTLP